MQSENSFYNLIDLIHKLFEYCVSSSVWFCTGKIAFWPVTD